MWSSLHGIVFLLVVFKEQAFMDSFKSEVTGSVLKTIEDIPNEFILLFESGKEFMEVFVPTKCLKDNTAMFKTFLNSRAKPVTLWTDGKMHFGLCMNKMCYAFRRSFFKIVYFLCDKYDFQHLWHSHAKTYFMSAFMVAEYTKHFSEDDRTIFTLPFGSPYIRASGRYVMSFDNGSLFVTSEFEKKQIEHQTITGGLSLERPRSLNGSFIHLICMDTYACQHSSFNVTLMLLKHRNASVSVDRNIPGFKLYSSGVINNLNYRANRDRGGIFDVLYDFASAGFAFYVPKRDPVPKEKIFILPFSWEVWVALIASCLLLVLTYALIMKVMLKGNGNIFLLIFYMMAAFFQQSTQLHTSLLSSSPSRLLYAIMTLTFVVMSTAFKGRLISLLNNLPLDGEASQFVSFEHLVGRGYRLCILEDPGILDAHDYLIMFTRNGSIRVGSKCYQTSNSALDTQGSIKISSDGRDTFFTYNSPTGQSEALRRELLGRGYVETEHSVMSYPVGPEMRASSVYRQDFGATLSRAIEAGIYERYDALAGYKSRFFHESSLEHCKELVLNFGDLRPFFLALFVGLCFSVLVFIGEVILFYVGFRNRSDNAKVIPRQPTQHGI